jgi:hypothetical protein
MKRIVTGLCGVALTAVAVTLVATGGAPAVAGGTTTPWNIPPTAKRGSVVPKDGPITIPWFSDSFTFNGVSYPYWMVGTNPETDASTTVVPTEIVPLRFVFSNGKALSGENVLNQTLASPIFQNAKFLSGTTQYGDAIERAMFWKYTAHTAHHTLLGTPTVLPELTINVPAPQGVYLNAGDPIGQHSHTVAPTGVVEVHWLYNVTDQIIQQLDLPQTLPILLTDNVVGGYKPLPTDCCLFGFHSVTPARNGSGSQEVRTSIVAAYGDPYVFANDPTFADVSTLSHEVSEWLHDPFLSSVVPSWSSPLAPQYGCSNLLETGDPLVGVQFDENGYQLQDEAFLSWFAHQSPSIGLRGRYSYLGTFTSPPPLC